MQRWRKQTRFEQIREVEEQMIAIYPSKVSVVLE